MSNSQRILQAATEAYLKMNDTTAIMENKSLGARVGNALTNLKNHAIITIIDNEYYWFGNTITVIYMCGTNYAMATLYPIPTDTGSTYEFCFLENMTYQSTELTRLNEMLITNPDRTLLYRLLIGTPAIDPTQIELLLKFDNTLVPKIPSPAIAIPDSVSYDNITHRESEENLSWNDVYENALYNVKTKLYKLYDPRDAILATRYSPGTTPTQTAYNGTSVGKTYFDGCLLTDCIDIILQERLSYANIIETFLDFLKTFCEGKIVINVVDFNRDDVSTLITASLYRLIDNYFCMRQLGGEEVLELNNGSVFGENNTQYFDRTPDETMELNPTILFLSCLLSTVTGATNNMMLFLNYCQLSYNDEMYRFGYAVFSTLMMFSD